MSTKTFTLYMHGHMDMWIGSLCVHVHVYTVEAKITFTYRLRRTVKVRLVSFPFYGQPFFLER